MLGVAKMNRVLDVDFENRTARVQAGITNLGISQAVAHEGFFYAPDPSSQLACTIAGNIAMNSGGAHCLKYGVTTNNLLGRHHGAARRHGGGDRRRASRQRRLRPPRPRLRLGRPARRRHGGGGAHPARGGGRAAGAVRLRDGRGCRRLRGGDHRRGHHSGRARIHGQARDPDLRGLRPCGLSARRGGDADRRGRGLGRGDRRHAPPHRRHRRAVQAEDHEGLAIGGRERGDLEGPQIGLRRHRARRRLHLHGRHDPDRASCPTCSGASTRS